MSRLPFFPARLTRAAAIFLAWNAHAQAGPAGDVSAEPGAPGEPPLKADRAAEAPPMQKVEIKGAAASYDPRRDDTASKIVVNSEEILKYGDTSVMDVLKRLPGITVSGAAGRSGSFSFRNGGPVRITERQAGFVSARRDLDMYALWKINPQNQLRIALSNLLAQDYIAESRYSDASGTLQRNSIAPGAVQARATMEMKF